MWKINIQNDSFIYVPNSVVGQNPDRCQTFGLGLEGDELDVNRKGLTKDFFNQSSTYPVNQQGDSQVELNTPVLALNWVQAPTTHTYTETHELASGDSTVIIYHLQAWVALAWRERKWRGAEEKQILVPMSMETHCDKWHTFPNTPKHTNSQQRNGFGPLRENTSITLYERNDDDNDDDAKHDFPYALETKGLIKCVCVYIKK